LSIEGLRNRFGSFITGARTGSSVPNVRQKILRGEMLDVEQIILHLVDAIGLSALFITDPWDTSKANAIFTTLVLNLDNFVYPLLFAENFVTLQPYLESRKRIIEAWAEAKVRREGNDIDFARELYMLTIKTLAEQRVFKTKREIYFGFGWLKEQQFELEQQLEKEEKAESGVEDATIPPDIAPVDTPVDGGSDNTTQIQEPTDVPKPDTVTDANNGGDTNAEDDS
jgi:hypothetical protein